MKQVYKTRVNEAVGRDNRMFFNQIVDFWKKGRQEYPKLTSILTE